MHSGKEIISDAKLLMLVADKLQNAVFKGFGKDFTSVDWDTPDAEMLHKLTQNVWHFSSAKNYQELKDLTLALKDDKGKLRTFTDFKEEALKINYKFNKTWLKTEYTQAVLSSTSAARWTDYMKNVEDMPYLKYETVGDKNVRKSHQQLDGIIKKYNDSFWDTHFPPNGWRCRCTVLQLPTHKAKETKDKDLPDVVIPNMFKTNLAKAGLLFPKRHAYYNGVPLTELKKNIWYLPKDAAYKELYKGDNGEILNMHVFHGINEARENIEIAKILLENGACKKIELLPILGENDDHIRKKLYGTKNFEKRKNPDALIDGELFDFKICKPTETSIDNNLKKKQAQNYAIYLSGDLEEKEIIRLVSKRKKSSNIQGVVKVITINNNILDI